MGMCRGRGGRCASPSRLGWGALGGGYVFIYIRGEGLSEWMEGGGSDHEMFLSFPFSYIHTQPLHDGWRLPLPDLKALLRSTNSHPTHNPRCSSTDAAAAGGGGAAADGGGSLWGLLGGSGRGGWGGKRGRQRAHRDINAIDVTGGWVLWGWRSKKPTVARWSMGVLT